LPGIERAGRSIIASRLPKVTARRLRPLHLAAGVLLAVPPIAATAADRLFEIDASENAAAKTRTLRVDQGDAVTILWRADRVRMLHLHGYDIMAEARPGEAAAMRFAARATGRFPVEEHTSDGRHITILFLEVHPR
jgi:hypothetical protein